MASFAHAAHAGHSAHVPPRVAHVASVAPKGQSDEKGSDKYALASFPNQVALVRKLDIYCSATKCVRDELVRAGRSFLSCNQKWTFPMPRRLMP